MRRSVRDRVEPRLAHGREARGAQHLAVAGGVRQPPLRDPARPVEPEPADGAGTRASGARSTWLVHSSTPRQTERIAASARSGSRRCSSRLPQTTTSNSPSAPAERSYTPSRSSRTCEPSSSRATSKPALIVSPGDMAQVLRARCSTMWASQSQPRVILDVGGDDLSRAAALELEGEEAIGGADVEAPHAADVGPRQCDRRSAGDRTSPGVTTPGASSRQWYHRFTVAIACRAARGSAGVRVGGLTARATVACARGPQPDVRGRGRARRADRTARADRRVRLAAGRGGPAERPAPAVRRAARSSAPTCAPAPASTGSRTCESSSSPTARWAPPCASTRSSTAPIRSPPRASCAAWSSPDGGVCILSSVMLMGIHGYPQRLLALHPGGAAAAARRLRRRRRRRDGRPRGSVLGVRSGAAGRRRWAFAWPSCHRWPAARGSTSGPREGSSSARFATACGQLGAEVGRQLPRVVRERGQARLSGR